MSQDERLLIAWGKNSTLESTQIFVWDSHSLLTCPLPLEQPRPEVSTVCPEKSSLKGQFSNREWRKLHLQKKRRGDLHCWRVRTTPPDLTVKTWLSEGLGHALRTIHDDYQPSWGLGLWETSLKVSPASAHLLWTGLGAPMFSLAWRSRRFEWQRLSLHREETKGRLPLTNKLSQTEIDSSFSFSLSLSHAHTQVFSANFNHSQETSPKRLGKARKIVLGHIHSGIKNNPISTLLHYDCFSASEEVFMTPQGQKFVGVDAP